MYMKIVVEFWDEGNETNKVEGRGEGPYNS